MLVQSVDPGSGRGRAYRFVAFIALLALALPSWAISLYDVIQLTKKGYPDEQIVAIIDATGSRFEVDAETIVTLKREGVREKVIQIIIAASDGPPAAEERQDEPQDDRQTKPRAEPWRTGALPDRETPVEPRPRARQPDVTASPAPPVPTQRSTPAFRDWFSSFPYEELSPGNHQHGNHQHYVIAMAGVPIIVLRSEAGFPSIAERAHAAAKALNGVVADRLPLSGSSRGVVAGTENGSIEILKVDRGDMVALQRRSTGPVAAARVGSYWAALLSDYVDLASGREPARLASSGIDSLRALYRQLARGSENSSSTDPASPSVLLAAVDRLPGEVRQSLVELATYLPAQFSSSEE